MRINNLFPGFQAGKRAFGALFLSGSGTNAEVLLQAERAGTTPSYEIGVMITDNPEHSRARELAKTYHKPLLELDIRKFYAERGENRISLDTPRRRELRELWTAELRRLLAAFPVNFGILAGFVPLSNITADYPCLNVHPGDLTVENPDGTRRYAGLHFLPVERAILDGAQTLRSSVILAQRFDGDGKGQIDAGPILGISPAVPVELGKNTLAELVAVRDARTTLPHRDRLREVAAVNLEKLKFAGDHVVFPGAIADFAAGCFGCDENGRLYFRCDREAQWMPIKTVEYTSGSRMPVKP